MSPPAATPPRRFSNEQATPERQHRAGSHPTSTLRRTSGEALLWLRPGARTSTSPQTNGRHFTRKHNQASPGAASHQLRESPQRDEDLLPTSSLRQSSAGCSTPRSKSRTVMLVVTRAPASSKHTRPQTRCTMVATGEQRAATTTDGNTRWEKQAETAKQQQAELFPPSVSPWVVGGIREAA